MATETERRLLKKQSMQIDLFEKYTAHFQDGDFVVLDFGKEMCGSVRILTFTPAAVKVRIRFGHRMASANVVLVEGENFADGEWESLEKSVLVMNTTRTAAIDLATGVATATGEAPSEGIVMKSNAEGFRAIVVP